MIGKVLTLGLLAVGLCFSNPGFARGGEGTDASEVFEERLTQYMDARDAVAKNPSLDSKEVAVLKRCTDKMFSFVDEYPESKYADDAQYVVLWNQSLSRIDLRMWEEFAEKFPDGKLEDSTIEYLKKAIPDVTPLTISEWRLPYGLLLTEIRATDALIKKDYRDAINYSNDFLAGIDKKNTDFKEVISYAYIKILVSYKNLHKRLDYDRVKKEALALFPEQEKNYAQIWK